MAGPYRWIDDLARMGWLPRLGAAELRLLWAVGVFWMRNSHDARADGGTLRAVTGLSESAFHEARNKLVNERKLLRAVPGIRQGKFRAYAVTVYRFTFPVPQSPTMPPHRRRGTSTVTPPRRSEDSALAEQRLRGGGDIVSPNLAADAATGALETLVRTQLVEGVVSSGGSRLAVVTVDSWREDLLRRFPSADGDAVLRKLVRAVRMVRRQPQMIKAVAFRLSRHLQYLGAMTWEREVLDRLQSVAGLPPTVTESEPLARTL